MSVEVYGIRHHGPGSARALARALAARRPDIVLIEGPPEADPLLPLAADPALVPPIALLAHTPDTPGPAAFWPFAAFSPEWTALRHALASGVPARFIDLPAAHTLAPNPPDTAPQTTTTEEDADGTSTRRASDAATRAAATGDDASSSESAEPARAQRGRPGVGESGAHGVGGSGAQGVRGSGAPGVGESGAPGVRGSGAHGVRGSGAPGVGESGAPGVRGSGAPGVRGSGAHGVRGSGAPGVGGNGAHGVGGRGAPGVGGSGVQGGWVGSAGSGEGGMEGVLGDPLGVLARAAGYEDAERWWDDVIEMRGEEDPFAAVAEAMGALREGYAASGREERREAWMRQAIRKAVREGYERVAVVCGAWHVPALREKVPASSDAAVLRGLPKVKVAVTWVPWTYGRLTRASGYGAGVASPGWYDHLFTAPDRPVERWLTATARVLREEGVPVSSGHVIEAVRLAEALAVLRGRPLPGLDELTEATRAVLCEGADLPVALVQRRLVVGERMGAVPESTPMVPLQHDLRAAQRRLRLKPAAEKKDHTLDLRKPLDLDRSRLLHRLRVLDVEWGSPAGAERGKGTFKETWTLLWHPEFDVRLIEAGAWGTTVEEAARARVVAAATATKPPDLPELTALAERCLLADLPAALPVVMRALADRAAADRDTTRLMAALPPLARSLRYGDVRGTPVAPLRAVVDGLVVRICLGLPGAASTLDDDAARALLALVDTVHETLALLDVPEHTDRWLASLSALADSPSLHGLLAGRLTRLLLDAGRVTDLPARMSRTVSVGTPPERAAAWIEGFLSDSALILIHDDALLSLLDSWLGALPPSSFEAALPLLRRTFARFAAPERRALATRARRPATAPASDDDLDLARAAPAVATVLSLLAPSGIAPKEPR
ncbi:DUF5682 family protein [Actinocorallia sp. API 0066]|uniref:DUF5682 family protein n=1 Tax=Actinocorallia sp. API 0066 TaxID=2896846 RepID=UPI001E604394|nr:DUF5682 family protein [Actinocorallia sp. API 0066]MCD0448674.1 DUF5682 family protein [Actinocorallia sp. API 0066]